MARTPKPKRHGKTKTYVEYFGCYKGQQISEVRSTKTTKFNFTILFMYELPAETVYVARSRSRIGLKTCSFQSCLFLDITYNKGVIFHLRCGLIITRVHGVMYLSPNAHDFWQGYWANSFLWEKINFIQNSVHSHVLINLQYLVPYLISFL